MIDASISSHICGLEQYSGENSNQLSQEDLEKIVQALSALTKQLSSFLITNAAGWGWCICRWAIIQLGDMSAKYSTKLNKVMGTEVGVGNIHNTLPIWLSMEGARTVIDMTTRCIAALKDCPVETERCVSVLLDTSVKYGSNFDWAVAHVGGCFPDTVIARVLSVGLKDYVSVEESSGHTMDHSGDGLTSHLSKEPKMSSVAGILGHLAISHQPNVRRCLNMTVRESFKDEDCEEGSEEEERKMATIPYLLHLASLSDPLRSAFTSEIRALFAAAPGVAAKVADLVPDWTADRYFPGPDSLAYHCVHLIIATTGHNGRDIIELLFDMSIDEKNATRAAKDASHGARYLLELLLSELLNKAHLTTKPMGNYPAAVFTNMGINENLPILKAVSENYGFFIGKYLLTNDAFQRKCILLLANLICLYKGRTAGLQTIQYGIARADDDEHCPDQLGAILQFVRDNEIWLPDIVDIAISQCIKLSLKSTIAFGREQATAVDPENFMDNLAAILHAQDVDEKKQPEGGITVSRFADCVRNHHADLLPLLGHKNLIIKILKIFHFVPLSKDMSVSLMHKAAHSFVHTLLVLIEDHDIIEEEEVRLEFMLQVMEILAHIAYSHPFGLSMVLRFLMEAAIKSPFAVIFGGTAPQLKDPTAHAGGILQSKGSSKTLYEENLKFGAMPTHPLGTSTSFHAGVIGEGKRPQVENRKPSQEIIESNTLTFVSLLFKLCHHHLNSTHSNNRERDQAREKSKEATKQLSLLLVDLVSPDIMYNGLPWPEEEFTRVTMERDLIISKTFDDHPILWKIIFGLAEARPSLCYCSVLIRAMLAVQMSHWQTSVVPRAELNPSKLDVTKRIIEAMSVGQFIPPPLDSISEVLYVMHPFHVHCILVDVWNYVRDNVPSPVSFSSNAEGTLVRDFEPYKNYKQYCERLRLVMIRHIAQLSSEFKRFFVDVSDKQDQAMKIAMEY